MARGPQRLYLCSQCNYTSQSSNTFRTHKAQSHTPKVDATRGTRKRTKDFLDEDDDGVGEGDEGSDGGDGGNGTNGDGSRKNTKSAKSGTAAAGYKKQTNQQPVERKMSDYYLLGIAYALTNNMDHLQNDFLSQIKGEDQQELITVINECIKLISEHMTEEELETLRQGRKQQGEGFPSSSDGGPSGDVKTTESAATSSTQKATGSAAKSTLGSLFQNAAADALGPQGEDGNRERLFATSGKSATSTGGQKDNSTSTSKQQDQMAGDDSEVIEDTIFVAGSESSGKGEQDLDVKKSAVHGSGKMFRFFS
ncbi:hypothetical protein F5Y16DRAFT_398993 [Xylariaceae sp. FL0255]|nr:hypothetical protein F5Y16DRAFT_398993 [Xylariaceae sp. FL0255]